MITVTELREQLGDAINKVSFGRERVIVTKQKKKVAAIVSMDDLKALEEFEAMENRLDIESVREAKLTYKPEDYVPWAKAKEMLAKKKQKNTKSNSRRKP